MTQTPAGVISGPSALMEQTLCDVPAEQQPRAGGAATLRPVGTALRQAQGRPCETEEGRPERSRGAAGPTDKGKRVERRGRKAMGLRCHGAAAPVGSCPRRHDCQAAEASPGPLPCSGRARAGAELPQRGPAGLCGGESCAFAPDGHPLLADAHHLLHAGGGGPKSSARPRMQTEWADE